MSAVQNIIKIKILEVIGASIILANRAAGIINCVRTMDMHIVDKSFGKCQFDPTTVAGNKKKIPKFPKKIAKYTF